MTLQIPYWMIGWMDVAFTELRKSNWRECGIEYHGLRTMELQGEDVQEVSGPER